MMTSRKAISVVIPVYNGREALAQLVRSLEATYSEPRPHLEFCVVDDGSTDRGLDAFFQQRFFARPDVRLKRRSRNAGFIHTVNEGVSLTTPDSDIVILNSDTEVWMEAFEKLRDVSLRHSLIGSVTPLTNNGTIASLFDFPRGKEGQLPFSAHEISATVERMSLRTPYAPAPTGVGFCMYIPRRAWEAVGELDPVFGRGYGEECDWSQRAIKAGYEHLIATEAYVHHTGTQSFTSEEKKKLAEDNARLLEARNPGYHASGGEYCLRDPWKLERLFLLASLVSRSTRGEETRLIVDSVAQAEREKMGAFIRVSPFPERRFRVEVSTRGSVLFDSTLHELVLPLVVDGLCHFVTQVNVASDTDWTAGLRCFFDGLSPRSEVPFPAERLLNLGKLAEAAEERDRLLGSLAEVPKGALVDFAAHLEGKLTPFPHTKRVLETGLRIGWKVGKHARALLRSRRALSPTAG